MGGEEDVVADDVAVVESNADPCACVPWLREYLMGASMVVSGEVR